LFAIENDTVSFMEDALVKEIRQFLADTGMSPLYFGKIAVGNSEMVPRLENGKTVTLRTAQKVRRFMSSYRRSMRGLARRVAAE
jgi:hypothetical protein